jgi:hypothetical protein
VIAASLKHPLFEWLDSFEQDFRDHLIAASLKLEGFDLPKASVALFSSLPYNT